MNWGHLVVHRGLPREDPRATALLIYVHILLWLRLHGRMSTYGNILSTFLLFSRESFEVTVSGGSTFARVKLKEIDGMAPQDVERAV